MVMPHEQLLIFLQGCIGNLLGELDDGLVILVPKLIKVIGPHQLRPIVLLETCLKLVARITMQRILSTWPLPDSMMGARAGAQVAEVAWLAKLLLARRRVYNSSCVLLKLDLSSAFDSLTHASIQQEMMHHYVPQQGASCRWFNFMVQHQRLIFQICDTEFCMGMDRGTVQGGTHSPALFSRVVALAAQRLQHVWESKGEKGPFLTGERYLWFIWFVDDGLAMFNSPGQLRRLMPELIGCLRDLGLQLNISKCKLLGWPDSQRLPPCLHGIQLVTSTVFLGCNLTTQPEAELHFVQGLMQRAVRAFCSNRRVLCHPSAPVHRRLQLFQQLVVSTFRWALGAVVPTQGILKALRVQGTTLVVWLLGLGCHRAWYSPVQLSCVRHVAKVWFQVFGVPWDVLALLLHIRLLGHMMRSSSKCISAGAGETEILEEALVQGRRRARRGPDLSGSRRLQSFLRTQAGGMADAWNKTKWSSYEEEWLSSFGRVSGGSCVKEVGGEVFMFEERCLQGVVQGSCSIFWTVHTMSILKMKEGWVVCELDAGATMDKYLSWTLAQIGARTIHLRLFSTFPIMPHLHMLQKCLSQRYLICEFSVHSSFQGPFACEAWQNAVGH